MLKFKNQDAYEARFRALQIVDERAAVKSVNGVLPDDAGAITLTPADINAVSVEDIANIRGTFRINVTSSNGVYSADKTFDEIKAAYAAGQLPYVVYTSLTSNFIYTLAHVSLPTDGAGQGFMSFESYSIFDDTLETETLRIFSYTLENGSNIEKQISPYNGQGVVGIQSVVQTVISNSDGGTNVITVTKTDGTSSTFTVKNGSKGSAGADGKSAYQYAQESGYTGTEEEFAEKLAQEQLDGTTLTLTPTQVYDAVSVGKPVKVHYFDGTYGSISFTVFNAKSSNVIVAQRIISTNGEYILAELIGNKPNGTWNFVTTTLAEKTDIPSLEGYATEAYVQNYHDNTKQDIITDLATIRSGASKGATAVQPEAGKGLFSGSYNDLTDKPAIPDTVTEGTVSGWGFTKNTGTYSKPAGGIPKADLAAAVQTSLGKADTALQTHQSLAAYRKAAEQDIIDNTKLTDAPTDGKAYARKNGSWHEIDVDALQSKSITDSGGHFTSDTVEGALQEIGTELAGINTLLGSGIQISFTIDGDPFSAVSGETWKEWIGGYSRVISEISGLTLYCFSDDGIIFADEAGVNALGLNDVWVHGNETIVSGATYAIIPCGG